MDFNQALIVFSLLVFLAVLFSKISARYGIPSLLFFILLGILAGQDGLLKISFNDYNLVQFLGIISLTFILFMGGLSVNTKEIKPVFKEGVMLATLGVLLTGVIFSYLIYKFSNLNMQSSMLLGAIISSTDAAAVFGILRSKNINLCCNLKSLLEFESGSNDPMAAFLTFCVINLIKNEVAFSNLFLNFIYQMTFGIILGYVLAKIFVFLINKIKLEYESLYVVLSFSYVLFCYSFCESLKINGFIVVYTLGLSLAHFEFINKKMLIKFHDALAWSFQIVMFITLGLLINFIEGLKFLKIAGISFLILTFIARPIAVFIIDYFSKRNLKEKIFISWIGLRGAAPVVLATFPLKYNVYFAHEIFNIVFFLVIISIFIQGSLISPLAKFLKLDKKNL